MRVYATTEELTTWLDSEPVPQNAAGLLRSASGLVRSETLTARYATDADGYPTDTALRTAFRDAVCAQVKFWADLKVDPSRGAAGVAPAASSKSIGGASITYETGGTAAKVEALNAMSPDAWYILNDAGLLGNPVRLT